MAEQSEAGNLVVSVADSVDDPNVSKHLPPPCHPRAVAVVAVSVVEASLTEAGEEASVVDGVGLEVVIAEDLEVVIEDLEVVIEDSEVVIVDSEAGEDSVVVTEGLVTEEASEEASVAEEEVVWMMVSEEEAMVASVVATVEVAASG